MIDESIEKLSKVTYSQQIYTKLEEMILCGKLKPGENITLRGLAAKYGVSIIPVRDALTFMESSGSIVKRTNKDYRIRTLSYEEFCDVMRIRSLLEREMILIVCRNATKADYYEFRKNLSFMEENLNNEAQYILYHYRYHMSIYQSVHKSVYDDLIKDLWLRIGPYMPLMWKGIGYKESLASHIRLEEVLETRDEKALAKEFEDHVKIGKEAMLQDYFKKN